MKKWWFNSTLSKGKFEYRRGLSKSIARFGPPIENTGVSEDPVRTDTDKNIHSWSESSSYSNVDPLVGVRDIRNLISDDTFLVSDSNRDIYSIYFDIQNKIFEIDNDPSFLSELESSFFYYWNLISLWNTHINSCIDSYLRSQICIEAPILSGSDNSCESYIYSYIWGESENSNEGGCSNIRTFENTIDFNITENATNSDFDTDFDTDSDFDTDFDTDLDPNYNFDPNSDTDFDTDSDTHSDTDSDTENSTHSDTHSDTKSTRKLKYRHLWVQCEHCYGLNYKKFFKSKMNICEQCGAHLKMHSSDRIDLLLDPDTWAPMNEGLVSLDPIEFHSEEDPYKDRIASYQRETGLSEAVQTGTGQLNGIPVAIGIMDFQFMGGSMGSVVGERITRLIEYATNQFLPLILVCASGGARMQEGSLSLMQMAKISSALYDYQSNKKLFYISILTSPTTGGVTASFGMLGDIIIAEPDAYIAFAGKRVIEQTLNIEVPEGSQTAEYLFDKGLFDPIVPRNLLKGVLSELLNFHGFVPLNLQVMNIHN
uniref:Acetyl-coenzyme A carboxylase carboxyl transferase subunit beta, chloroplastic n=1 Tax=Epilobium hirsutum TaxID=210355 RepID=A0A8E6B3G7_9MYRT|nr:acetyl-CoA carboxylase subunit beta [Epilobium hirsutum]QVL23061.1 acetyl-CoA carboxylase subunit beta [Epilobium hirsutum]